MFRNKNEKRARLHTMRRTAVAAGLIAMLASTGALATKIGSSNDWDINWDNTVTYNLGMRTEDVNPKIGNNPNYDEGDYKFGSAGDVVTNRLSLLSEFMVSYKGNVGFKVSGSTWKDFAYDSNVETNPGVFAPAGGHLPAVTYRALSSYPSGQYTSYTNRFYVQGGQLLDAFAFYNPEIAGVQSYLKVGQFTEYWGNSLFFPYQGISTSQGALDLIKGFASPGTQTKELLLPRQQVSLTTQVTPQVSLSAQYAYAWDPNRLPTGGTYLGPLDFYATGPTSLFAAALPGALIGHPGGYLPVNIPQGPSLTPPDTHANYGFKVGWTPEFFNGAMGFYYRKFDETQPWVLADFGPRGLPTDYHLAYNEHAELYGYSLDTTIGNVSTGFEASYRRNTGLNSNLNAKVTTETEGATGNVLNLIGNAIVPLSRSSLWDTGTLIAEVSYSQLTSVTQNALLYNAVGYGGCPTNNKWNGCSTKQYAGLSVSFNPQWLQVFPGIDLSAPISDTIGLYGNNPINGTTSAQQGTHNVSVGIQALWHQRATLTLAYNQYFGKPNVTTTGPAGQQYYSAGNGLISLDDRPWLSLTLQTSF